LKIVRRVSGPYEKYLAYPWQFLLPPPGKKKSCGHRQRRFRRKSQQRYPLKR
jgi:hypothetical protein